MDTVLGDGCLHEHVQLLAGALVEGLERTMGLGHQGAEGLEVLPQASRARNVRATSPTTWRARLATSASSSWA